MPLDKKPFSVYPRKVKKGKVYYAQFRNADGSWCTAKSTGQTSKNKAEAWCINYLQTGGIIQKENVTFTEFSKNFFAWDGEYSRDRQITGKRISKRQCDEKTAILKNHIIPAFGKYRLTQIDKQLIKDFRNDLYFNKGLAGSTVNKILSIIDTILKSAEDKSLIQYCPRIEKVTNKPKVNKGILTIDELQSLFSVNWSDFRAYVMSLTAASTGLRRGELLALQIKNVKLETGYIEVLKSYDEILKKLNDSTKNGRSRLLIIPEKVKSELSNLIRLNPYKSTDSFVFFSTQYKDRPIKGEYVNKCLYKALSQIGINESERKSRVITFHSFRHLFNSILINSKIPLAKVQSLTGHLTASMSQETYYHADDLSDVKAIQESLFNFETINNGEISWN